MEVDVPPGEAASIGTFRAIVHHPGGRNQEITGPRDGTIAGVWLEDVCGGGHPEMILWMVSAGSGSYATIAVYGLETPDAERLDLAPLPDDVAQGYRGHDRIDIREGRIIRIFPTYRSADTNAAPTGGETRLAYSFATGAWIREP